MASVLTLGFNGCLGPRKVKESAEKLVEQARKEKKFVAQLLSGLVE